MKNNTYSVRSQAVSTVKKSHATIPCAWARRNSPHVGPSRRGAGPKPERLRIDLIVVAPTRMPSLRSSPWIRTQPTWGSPAQAATQAREAQDRAAADPASGAGNSISSAPAHAASGAASAAKPATPTSDPAAAARSPPPAAAGRAAAAAAASPSAAAPPAVAEAPLPPPPGPRQPNPQQAPEEASHHQVHEEE